MDISFGYKKIFCLDMHEYEWIYLDILSDIRMDMMFGYIVWIVMDN